ncbi:MAG TPA: hypothetical protein VKB89_31670 [Xanthobacteraceae bacterium]|nr:hypothetical protein [Xanthobacteraceae bacterium]
MSVILSLLGIAVAAAGVAAIGFGIPINEFTLGTTLIVAGVSALTGGLVLLGLAAVVAELGRLSETMRTRLAIRPTARSGEPPEFVQPMTVPANLTTSAPTVRARPVQAHSAPPKPEALQVPPVDAHVATGPSPAEVSATERLQTAEPSIVADEEGVTLSPNAAAHLQTHQPRTFEAVPPEPEVSSEDRAGGAAVEALKASRLDFLFRSKPARPVSRRENFDAVWPSETRAGRRFESESSVEASQPEHGIATEDHPPKAAPLEEPQGNAILKSGVVDGMAYTLYRDGSIEAKLPHGTVKFGSIAELRAHIESNS